ncbi:MAG TPA: inositol monophosphatase family protein [Thermoanaerobaculia bacterium]|nr:inositol monophosphatase family protein [Thermoanaerobaculia bacterium]
MNADLSLALRLAGAADAITMRHFRSASLAVRTKVDMTPVSEADEETERALREILAAERPGDGIVGEEFGSTGNTTRRWILDPIDATKNYVRGNPVFATLIALESEGVLAAGVVSAPALARRWWASRGDGAFCNGERMHVSAIATIEESYLAYDSIHDFDSAGSTDAFIRLVRRCARTRAFGDFWAHMLVAEGALEIAIEPIVKLWDMAPVQLIVEEAGGRFTDLRGNTRADGGSALSTNGVMHDEVLEHFR